MKLLCFPALDEAGSIAITYGQAKRLLLAAEANGTVSIRVLQSAILLSLYETAHAIYPAAYMTVGYCARLGYAMGIHDRKNVPQMFPVPGMLHDNFAVETYILITLQVHGPRWRSAAEYGGRS